MNVIYISGAMTGQPDNGYPRFNAMARRLRAAGWSVRNPATKGTIPGWTWEQYLRQDLKQLLLCSHILMLEGWRKSPGARLEHSVAVRLGFTVLYERSFCEETTRSMA